jgi:hypothetical protein
MTQQPKPAPLIKAGGLWAKSSAKGGQYLTGRLGGMKVLVLENRDRKTDDDPSHHLCFAEAPDRRQGVQERGGGQRAGADAPRTAQRPPAAHRSGFQGHAGGADDLDLSEWAR